MTWAEHVSLIGNIEGVATRLGWPSEHLRQLAHELQSEPVILGAARLDDDPFGMPWPHYDTRTVVTRGKLRVLRIPVGDVSLIQKGLRDLLRLPAEELLHPSCHGYRTGHSTRSNAAPHVGKAWVQKLDVHDFFGSTTTEMVTEMLVGIGFDEESSALLSGLATVEGSLPLGSPSSPVISNLMLASFDEELAQIAAGLDVTYTRYADDLAFSSDEQFDVLASVEDLLERRGYSLAPAKHVVAKRGQNLTVTGLVVWDGEHPRLPKAFRNRLETELHYIERFGMIQHADRVYAWSWIDPDAQPERHAEQSRRHVRGKVLYALSIQREWTQGLLSRYPAATKVLMGTRQSREDGRNRRVEFLRKQAATIRARRTPSAPRWPGLS